MAQGNDPGLNETDRSIDGGKLCSDVQSRGQGVPKAVQLVSALQIAERGGPGVSLCMRDAGLSEFVRLAGDPAGPALDVLEDGRNVVLEP